MRKIIFNQLLTICLSLTLVQAQNEMAIKPKWKVGDRVLVEEKGKMFMTIYVKDVDQTFQRAMDLGCESIEKPKQREGDPDRRGSFKDFSGNIWSIGTQLSNE